ncbi:MAG: diheme cytochrome c-553 [Vicinamibacterales bacterium]
MLIPSMRTVIGVLSIAVITSGCADAPPQSAESEQAQPPAAQSAQSAIERGKYLVTIGACHDCHTPKTFGPAGPEPDMSRELSGHPANETVAPVPAGLIGPDAWGAVGNNHFTAWAGPWGVSFSRNLTPDVATGLGSWTEDMFIQTIRDGKHQGVGRPLLPPMPWQMIRVMTDDDLKAVFAYLQSLPPVANAVPEPLPPGNPAP